jgi:superfamily II DNA helicase RecQ
VLLAELFDFTHLQRSLNYCLKIINEHSESILENPQKMFEDSLTGIRTDLIEVAGKFQLQVRDLLKSDPDAEANAQLQERLRKAGEFFAVKLEQSLKEIIDGFSIETDNKTVRKAITEAVDRLRKEVLTRLACLEVARSGFSANKYLAAKSKSFIDVPATKSRPSKATADSSGTVRHPELFRLLKDWRNRKAKEEGLAHYMIMHQKTMLNLADLLPQSMSALKKVKGIGKKKADKYGEELLEIIVSYNKKEKIEADYKNK